MNDIEKQRAELILNFPRIMESLVTNLMLKNIKKFTSYKAPTEFSGEDSKAFLKEIVMNLYYSGYVSFIVALLLIKHDRNAWPTLEVCNEEIDKLEEPTLIVLSLLQTFFTPPSGTIHGMA